MNDSYYKQLVEVTGCFQLHCPPDKLMDLPTVFLLVSEFLFN